MEFKEFKTNVEQWAMDRQIYKHSTTQAQTLKTVSKLGELADGVIKADRALIIDSVGDTLVCLINVCFMAGVDPHECMQAAWDEIKDRKGYMVPGGAFVKEE